VRLGQEKGEYGMIQLKACQRCGGDMMLEEILGEAEFVCLQCGHRSPSPQRPPALSRK